MTIDVLCFYRTDTSFTEIPLNKEGARRGAGRRRGAHASRGATHPWVPRQHRASCGGDSAGGRRPPPRAAGPRWLGRRHAPPQRSPRPGGERRRAAVWRAGGEGVAGPAGRAGERGDGEPWRSRRRHRCLLLSSAASGARACRERAARRRNRTAEAAAARAGPGQAEVAPSHSPWETPRAVKGPDSRYRRPFLGPARGDGEFRPPRTAGPKPGRPDHATGSEAGSGPPPRLTTVNCAPPPMGGRGSGDTHRPGCGLLSLPPCKGYGEGPGPLGGLGGLTEPLKPGRPDVAH
ncbi:uncharacterized protein LOC142053735 [Phalacrocorax aristotelis]|uniref:uncharacterized protein LOC142053735 n=1 Tax=Phalacrocorax aristotelis TaxID=126867 RepID=UPI003F4C012B